MAIITEPMALDASFNTTETTPRSQADVLAGIEQAILHGMGRTANEVAYDNTTSGLSADDVQEAIDELAEEKVDKVTGKGLSTNDYTTAEKEKLAGIEAGAQVNPTIDSELSDSSTNAVQNKVVKDALDGKADNADVAGTQSVSGNPITLTDASETYAQSLVVELEPIQEGSGDPSPTNVRPITGYTECEVDDVGFNQWNEEWEVGTLNPTTGQNATDTTRIRSKGYIPVLPSTTYHFVCSANDGRGAYYDINKQFIRCDALMFTRGEFTAPDNCYYVRFSPVAAYGTTYNNDISINYPSTVTTYEPYHSSNATIQFGQTVYGGKVNVTDGGTSEEYAIVNLGDLTWSYRSNGVFSAELSDYLFVRHVNALCEGYKYIDTIGGISLVTENGGVYLYWNTGGTDRVIYIKNTNYSDADVFKASVTGIKFAYKKATPSTIATPPTELKLLKGTNNLTTNGTTINLDYIPDNSIGDAVKASEEYADRAVNGAMPISGTVNATLLHEEDQGEDWIVGFTGEIDGHFDTDQFDYYLTARYTHAYNTNTQILNMNNCSDGDYVNIWQTGSLDFAVDGGVTVDISVTATKLTFTVNCIGDSIFGIYSSSETTGEVKYLITPARKG